MSAAEEAAKARARMEQVRREMIERRALRDRNGRAAHQRAHEALMKQGQIAEQVAKRLGELGRRRELAGGWATEKTDRDKDYLIGFGGEEERTVYRPAPPRAVHGPTAGIGALEDDEVEEPPSAPEPEPVVESAPEPEEPAVSRPAPARGRVDDDEDFSNQSSWMQRR